jgi:hypothetical protein
MKYGFVAGGPLHALSWTKGRMREGYLDSVACVNGHNVTLGNKPPVMPCVTVELFTSAVLVLLSLYLLASRDAAKEPMLLARGRATVSALSGRRNLHARTQP